MRDLSSSCVFCRILNGQLPGSFVYQDELVAAFMDIHPVNPGHLLIVPRRHESAFAHVPFGVAGRMFQVAQKLRMAMDHTSGLRIEGANIFLSDGEAAGQEVPHAHLHVVPRFAGDRHRMGFSGTDANAGARPNLDEMASRLRARLVELKAQKPLEGIEILKIGAEHVADWANLRDQLWPGSGVEAQVTFARPDMGIFLARRGEHAVAFCEVSERNFANGCEASPVGFLEGVYVDPSFRHRGVGRALVDCAISWAAERGLRELASDAEVANAESLRAHQAWGFTATEQVQYFRFTIPATFPGHRP